MHFDNSATGGGVIGYRLLVISYSEENGERRTETRPAGAPPLLINEHQILDA